MKKVVLLAVLIASIPCSAGIIYVDAGAVGDNNGTSWGHAFADLQDALTAAGATDIINVALGTYRPTSGGDRNATFQLKNGVDVYGGYPSGGGTRSPQANVTTLSGDLNGDDIGSTNNVENSYHVVTGSGTDPTAVLDGFTITGGNANAASLPNSLGGGMYNDYGSPTVANCTFTGNSANSGGGMLNYNDSGPMVTNCTFSGNSAGYSGGGMYNYSGSPTVTNCTFSGNSAALLMFGNGGGGMYNYLASPAITNCTFSGNWSERMNGGGMFNENCNPTITNCTFSKNSAVFSGGGIYGKDATINNSVFWGNTAPNDPQIGNAGTTTVSYSDIQGGYAGTGNIDADPLFADPDGPDNLFGTEDDDLRLSAGSPCIDAGDNTALPADTADLDNDGNTIEPIPFDLDGSIRIVNGTADMGAYEYPIQLLSPNGAEVMIAGTTYDITWRPDGNIANVSLEYSDANGLAWTVIDPNTPDDGQYEWTVPNVTSDLCLVRVSDAGDPDIFDVSDDVFTIFQASPPVVLSPNGGEVFIAAGTETITWEAMERLNFVTIELSDANGIDGSWEVIDPNTPNDGQYEWTVPDVTSDQCLVRVSYTDIPGVLDDSNDMFTIYVCQINPFTDLNNDCKANMPDLGIISAGWPDVHDLNDLTILAKDWLRNGNPFDDEYTEPLPIMWVYIDDPNFTGQMSKYETTNAQYCEFLNAALVSGDISVSDANTVYGANGSNGGADFAGEIYYWVDGLGEDYSGAINGGAARINYNGSSFTVDSGFDDHPVTWGSWHGSTAFCNYYGYRLPTEWEWQAIADYDGSFNYGCGTSINTSIANYRESTHPDGTTVVGSFGAYGYGMCDLAGNVWEWTSSCFHAGCSPDSRVVRGGSWYDGDYNCTVSNWFSSNPDGLGYGIGFRVCR